MNYAEQFIMTNMEKLPAESIPMLRQRLSKLDNNQMQMIMAASGNLKDSMIAVLLAFFFGEFGADRFYLGKTNDGIKKLLICLIGLGIAVFTLGISAAAVGIYLIVDCFRTPDRVKQTNLEKINFAISNAEMMSGNGSNQMNMNYQQPISNMQQPVQGQQQNVAAQQPVQGQMAQPQQPVQPQAAQGQQNVQSSVAPQSTSSVNSDASMSSQDSNNSTL